MRALVFDDQVRDDGAPVLAIAHQPQIAERFLGRAEFSLALGELVGEFHEEVAEPFALMLRQREDAGHVVALGGFLFLAEVADQVAAALVAGGHAVEEEGVDVVVEGFVVEEEFGEQAEVTAPRSLAATVDLEEGDIVVAVDLVAWRVHECAFGAVAGEGL